MTYGVGPVCRDAATDLRAFAEREKELVEALEKIATDCEADGPGTIHEGLAKFARAILAKLKEQS
jgi:hypothetical protein